MIQPDSQRGFETYLTHCCNSIANKTGGKTWVIHRPSSPKMLKQCEFKKVANRNADLKRWDRKESLGCSLEKLRGFLCVNFFLAI